MSGILSTVLWNLYFAGTGGYLTYRALWQKERTVYDRVAFAIILGVPVAHLLIAIVLRAAFEFGVIA